MSSIRYISNMILWKWDSLFWYKKTILIVVAHPDDEMLFAGIIAYLTRLGFKVVIVFATRGEGGQTNGVCTQAELGERRVTGELRNSMHHLGVRRDENVITLDLGDGHLKSKEGEFTEILLDIMMRIKPHYVFAFSEDTGVTGHEDHKVSGKAARIAAEAYKKITGINIRFYNRIVPKGTAGIVNVLHDESSYHLKVNVVRFWAQIRLALKAHKTQLRAMATIFLFLSKKGKLWTHEYYTRVKL
jgi:LmbE family N-acetylglucosaminyl deacetylase